MTEGKITAVDGDGVEIDGTWYRMGEKINPTYVKVGDCEYTPDIDGETVNFIRMKKAERKFGKPKSFGGARNSEPVVSQYREPNQILKQECLNTAKDIMIANKDKDAIKPEDVVNMAVIFQQYVQIFEMEKG